MDIYTTAWHSAHNYDTAMCWKASRRCSVPSFLQSICVHKHKHNDVVSQLQFIVFCSHTRTCLYVLTPLQLEGLVERLQTEYEDYIHGLQQEHLQYKTDAENREQSVSKLLHDLGSENERLVEQNVSLKQELNTLQTRYRATEASLKVSVLFSVLYIMWNHMLQLER